MKEGADLGKSLGVVGGRGSGLEWERLLQDWSSLPAAVFGLLWFSLGDRDFQDFQGV